MFYQGALLGAPSPMQTMQISTHHSTGKERPTYSNMPLPALYGKLQNSTSLGRYQPTLSPALDFEQRHASRPTYGRAPFNRSVDQHPARAEHLLHSTFSQLTSVARAKQKKQHQLASYLRGPMLLSTDTPHMASYLHTQASSRY